MIGGGQAGLALGYYLRRTDLTWRILDDRSTPGGAWTSTWDSLRLFSPARWSSLPGRLMEGGEDKYPTRDAAIAYFEWYETHYDLQIERPRRVTAVVRSDEGLRVETKEGAIHARAVVSATGMWSEPVLPKMAGCEDFAGIQLHSAHYANADPFVGKRVAVVGAGNSAAQILAEVSTVGHTFWCTLDPPRFLPDDIDGRYLFNQATVQYRAQQQGLPVPAAASLGDIVMVESVRKARDRGALKRFPMFAAMTPTGARWPDGTHEVLDAVIWATGFRAALGHLHSLELSNAEGKIETRGTRSKAEPRLWLVGYGGWTGYASATVIGVGRTARETVKEIIAMIDGSAR